MLKLYDQIKIKATLFKDTQRIKERCGERQENTVWAKWKYQ